MPFGVRIAVLLRPPTVDLGAAFLGLIPHDPPDILNDNGRRRRCSEADVAANNACNVGSYVSGAPSDDSFCELFYLFGGPAADAAGVPMTRETCRDAKPGEPADDIHILCSKFTITTQDIFRYLSPSWQFIIILINGDFFFFIKF